MGVTSRSSLIHLAHGKRSIRIRRSVVKSQAGEESRGHGQGGKIGPDPGQAKVKTGLMCEQISLSSRGRRGPVALPPGGLPDHLQTSKPETCDAIHASMARNRIPSSLGTSHCALAGRPLPGMERTPYGPRLRVPCLSVADLAVAGTLKRGRAKESECLVSGPSLALGAHHRPPVHLSRPKIGRGRPPPTR